MRQREIPASRRPRADGNPFVIRRPNSEAGAADVTLINLNLMLANLGGRLDRQNYLPLGLLYIAACLQRAGHPVELIDYQLFSQAEKFDAETFVSAVGRTAEVVGISCMSNLLPFAIQCAKVLKERRPERRIVLGGVGPSPVARPIIKEFGFVDHVVEGEGELTMLEILRGRAGRIPRRRIPARLDDLPLPAYSLIDFSLYDAAPSIITSRGCPYRCTFCTEPYNFGGCARAREDLDSIVAEMEALRTLSGRDLFLFQDDILPLNRPKFRRLLKRFREDLTFPVRWKCFSRVDLMDDALMEEMAASGCVQVRYGIESGSNRTLRTIRKGFTIEQARETALRSLKYFPSVHAAFMWGFPFEDMPAFEETLDAVRSFGDAGITVLVFEYSPLPGSPIYRQWKGRRRLAFSDRRYSSFVISGCEAWRAADHQPDPRHVPLYRMIAEHPDIFPGFYQFADEEHLEKRRRLSALPMRPAPRNEHDL